MYHIKKNRVFLEELPLKVEGGRQIDWKNCIGKNVKYIYKNEYGEFEITDYEPKKNMLTIIINDKTVKIATNQLRKCPFGYVLGFKTMEYRFDKGDVYNDMKIIKRKRIPHGLSRHGNPRTERGYEYECLKCGGIHDIYEQQLLREITCPICCNRVMVKGINDIATTHPELARFFNNIEDAYTCSWSSPKMFEMKCPDCGTIKNSSPNKLSRTGFYCNVCSDGISYSEKFISSLLKQAGVEFEREKTFSWSNKKRYDFYIPSLNCIIEAHGMQHYEGNFIFSVTEDEALRREKENDRLKQNLAKDNYIERYIVLDCRKSELDWVKSSILNSDIPNIIDISNVDYNICEKDTMTNVIKTSCELYNEGKSINEIAEMQKLHGGTINNYLHKGTKLGFCNYSPRNSMLHIWKNNGKRVEAFDPKGVSLGIYDTMSELARISLNKFGVEFNPTSISQVCRGINKHHWGYTFRYAEENSIGGAM